MKLPVLPPLPPMDALAVEELPVGNDWQYEPKWDGFRCLVFRDGKEIELQSKSGQPLGRYFPEIIRALAALNADRFVLDGELAIPLAQRFSFDDLLQRIHPAKSRVEKLSRETPAVFIAFDLLLNDEGTSLLEEPLRVRRPLLEQFASEQFQGPAFRLSPVTADMGLARAWLEGVGGELDGVIAKRLDCPYMSGERSGMQKVKLIRTADCVVGGFRYSAKGRSVGSLLLGLYDEDGLLHHVGFCSGLSASERVQLLPKLEALIEKPGFTGRAPGGPSRWSTKRSTEWEPLRPEMVVEVSYDHFTGGRFRHGTSLVRWRPDKAPSQCRMEQVARRDASFLPQEFDAASLDQPVATNR